MKHPPVWAEVFHAARQTDIDMTKLKFALRKSANAPKNVSITGCEMSAYNVTDYVIHGRGSHNNNNNNNIYLLQ